MSNRPTMNTILAAVVAGSLGPVGPGRGAVDHSAGKPTSASGTKLSDEARSIVTSSGLWLGPPSWSFRLKRKIRRRRVGR